HSSMRPVYSFVPSSLRPNCPSSLPRRLPRSPPFPSTTLFRPSTARKEPYRRVSPQNSIMLLRLPHPLDEHVLKLGLRRFPPVSRSEEHTSELQSRENLVCRLLLEKKNTDITPTHRFPESLQFD